MFLSRPFQNLQPSMFNAPSEICVWNNPYDGLYQFASIKHLIKPCCAQVSCFHSDSDSQWGNWGQWSSCSASCGGGLRNRQRSCLNSEMTTVQDCRGDTQETASCNNVQCPRMLNWSAWSQCSTSCGQGVSTRNRVCSSDIPNACGDEMSYDQRPCSLGGCMTPWSPWSDCTVQCGGGRQYRSRSCADEMFECKGNVEDERRCNTDFCEMWSPWQPDSACISDLGPERPCGQGKENWKRTCINGEPGAPGCQGPETQQKVCRLAKCPTYGSWSTWSGCNDGTQFRTRDCLNNEQLIGCDGKSSETKSCSPRFSGGYGMSQSQYNNYGSQNQNSYNSNNYGYGSNYGSSNSYGNGYGNSYGGYGGGYGTSNNMWGIFGKK